MRAGLLGIVAAYVAKALTDRDMSELTVQLHGPKISPSAVPRAREAIARILGAACRRIPEYLVACATFVQFDNTTVH